MLFLCGHITTITTHPQHELMQWRERSGISLDWVSFINESNCFRPGIAPFTSGMELLLSSTTATQNPWSKLQTRIPQKLLANRLKYTCLQAFAEKSLQTSMTSPPA
ncbi:hypothetical protein Y032_0133g1778 [Ancylostoma ceylanicum]|uniref:Uncharacterized protein n=1 Tax=Ancylostoma ceylanicum TaxID=53326 RepID=A0A016T5H8_9BILA|nr:hypothetical protein Y032_0133g1778 [Ancylostoma ceylanicum]